jgi:hypothetical protein
MNSPHLAYKNYNVWKEAIHHWLDNFPNLIEIPSRLYHEPDSEAAIFRRLIRAIIRYQPEEIDPEILAKITTTWAQSTLSVHNGKIFIGHSSIKPHKGHSIPATVQVKQPHSVAFTWKILTTDVLDSLFKCLAYGMLHEANIPCHIIIHPTLQQHFTTLQQQYDGSVVCQQIEPHEYIML